MYEFYAIHAGDIMFGPCKICFAIYAGDIMLAPCVNFLLYMLGTSCLGHV